jgi:hypothetical protein
LIIKFQYAQPTPLKTSRWGCNLVKGKQAR